MCYYHDKKSTISHQTVLFEIRGMCEFCKMCDFCKIGELFKMFKYDCIEII